LKQLDRSGLAARSPHPNPLPQAGDGEVRATLIKRLFAIDLRSLAFFRILLASCLAIDFMSALVDFSALYSDAGVLPRNAAIEFWSSSVTTSLYLMTGQPVLIDLLLVVHGAVILALLVGYRSRIAAALCFVFTASLQNRNFLVLQSSDDLMRLLVFWAMFAPIGGKWSVDAALNEVKPPPYVLSLGAFALQCQALFVYFFGALIKTQSEVWTSGAAVAMAVADSTYGTDLARVFLGYPGLLRALTLAVLSLELLAPFLIWFPLPGIRLVALALLAMMHLGFVVFLHVGIFPLVSLTSLSMFLPPVVWDRLASRKSVQRAAAIRIYYDGGCLFCFKTALLLREFCLPGTVPIAKAETHPEAKRLLETHNSWVVYDDTGAPRLKWDAVAYVLRQSPVLWPFGRLFERDAMKKLGERLYGIIGDNRPGLGRLTARLLPFHRDAGGKRLLGEFVCVALLVIVTLYNVATLRGYEDAAPQWLAAFVVDARFEQKWTMFAPVPQSRRSWLVARAVTSDGRVIDIFHGRRRPYQPEPTDWPPFHLQKWLKFYENLIDKRFSPLRLYYGRYLCRVVNDGVAPNDIVGGFTLYLFIEPVDSNDITQRETIELWDHHCF
jgi:hypothetical protein